MLEGSNIGRTQLRTELSILGLLDVGQKLFLSLTTTERTVLLGVHSKLEELFVVLSVVPTVLVHLLLETFEGIGDEGVRIGSSKLTVLLLGQLDELGIDGAWHLAALAENHTPDGIVHHDVTALALFHRKQIHQGDVLGVLREWRHQWGITHARPYIFYLIEQLHKHVVH